MKYTWMGATRLFVPGVGTIPPSSTFEMDKASLKMAGVHHLIKTGELQKGADIVTVKEPEPDLPDEPEIFDPVPPVDTV